MEVSSRQIPSGLLYQPNFLKSDTHRSLIQAIDANPWSEQLSRRVQHYIHYYDYKTPTEIKEAPPPPPLLKALGDHLYNYGMLRKPAQQIIVNEYYKGQGISAHSDFPIFGDDIVIISLNDPVIMHFTKGSDDLALCLEPGSLAVMRGEVRTDWKHSIKKNVRETSFDGKTVDRNKSYSGGNNYRRISITYRYYKN